MGDEQRGDPINCLALGEANYDVHALAPRGELVFWSGYANPECGRAEKEGKEDGLVVPARKRGAMWIQCAFAS